jgi:hypothetical protein
MKLNRDLPMLADQRHGIIVSKMRRSLKKESIFFKLLTEDQARADQPL